MQHFGDFYNAEKLPQHIAIIMDGNGRWAKSKLRPRVFGHYAGVESVREITQTCLDLKIKCLTLFAFSSENWLRPKVEVTVLINLIKKLLIKEIEAINEAGICLKVIGSMDNLDPNIILAINNAMQVTKNNNKMFLNIAFNYGGRWDIVQAAKNMALKYDPNDFTEDKFAKEISLADLPELDLLIRTSGEQRISNFLLWQAAYAEIYFTNLCWPDFRKQNLLEAIRFFNTRERRFGKISEQLLYDAKKI